MVGVGSRERPALLCSSVVERATIGGGVTGSNPVAALRASSEALFKITLGDKCDPFYGSAVSWPNGKTGGLG